MPQFHALNQFRLEKGRSVSALARQIGVERWVLDRYLSGESVADYNEYKIDRFIDENNISEPVTA